MTEGPILHHSLFKKDTAGMIHYPEVKQDWPFHSYLSDFMLVTDTQGVGWWCRAS